MPFAFLPACRVYVDRIIENGRIRRQKVPRRDEHPRRRSIEDLHDAMGAADRSGIEPREARCRFVDANHPARNERTGIEAQIGRIDVRLLERRLKRRAVDRHGYVALDRRRHRRANQLHDGLRRRPPHLRLKVDPAVAQGHDVGVYVRSAEQQRAVAFAPQVVGDVAFRPRQSVRSR